MGLGINPQQPFEGNFSDPIELDVRPTMGTGGIQLDSLLARMLDETPQNRPTANDVLTQLTEASAMQIGKQPAYTVSPSLHSRGRIF
jgi:hypothetical protein